MPPKNNDTGIGPVQSPARRQEPFAPSEHTRTLFPPMPVRFALRHQPATRTPKHGRLEPLPRVESGAAGLSSLLQVTPLRHRELSPLPPRTPAPGLMGEADSRATPEPLARQMVSVLPPLSVPPPRSSVVSAHQPMPMIPTPAPSPMG